TMNCKSRIAAVRHRRLSGVDAHPHLDFDLAGPRVRNECRLALHRGEDCFTRTEERDEEGVTLRIDLVAAVRLPRAAKQPLMLRENRVIPVAQCLHQPSRALDVGEKKGDCSGGERFSRNELRMTPDSLLTCGLMSSRLPCGGRRVPEREDGESLRLVSAG